MTSLPDTEATLPAEYRLGPVVTATSQSKPERSSGLRLPLTKPRSRSIAAASADQKTFSRPVLIAIQVGIAVAFVLAWQFLPDVSWLSAHYKFLNRFFISSPSSVADRLGGLMTGNSASKITLWTYLWTTVEAVVLGVAIGLVAGALAGLVCSSSRRLSDVLRPFLVIFNTIPKITLIPVYLVIVGPTVATSIISVVTVVFFLAFFNAFEGGRSVQRAVIDSAILLGARPRQIMWTIRFPQVLVWTLVAIPNAVAFGVVVAVTTELLSGVNGMGTLLEQSLQQADSTLTMAVVVVLSVVGLGLYYAATLLQKALLWWQN